MLPLETLRLQENSIGTDGLAALVEGLLSPGGSGVRVLVLDGNPLGEESGAALGDLIRRHPSLASLSLARCELGPSAFIAVSEAVGECTHESRLQRLDLSEPRSFSLNCETVHHIGTALRFNPVLASLSLRKHPHLSDDAVSALLDYALDSPSLVELDLSANRLGPTSGEHFARALEAGLALQRLSLASCRLGDIGAAALARVLGSGTAPSLQDVDLRHCDVGEGGLTALAAALTSPSCPLRAVQLWGNRLRPGEPGATALGEALLRLEEAGGGLPFATDLRAYSVDGAVMLAQQELQ